MSEETKSKPTKKDLSDMLENMIKNIEGLPPHAMGVPINHYDFYSLLVVLLGFFKDEA